MIWSPFARRWPSFRGRGRARYPTSPPRRAFDGEGRACSARPHLRCPRLADRDHPEDTVVLEPRCTLDQRPQIQLVGTGRSRSRDRELEPCDLSWTDVVGGLYGDAVVSRPAGVGRAELTVTAKSGG